MIQTEEGGTARYHEVETSWVSREVGKQLPTHAA